jgi:hypothetical protein
MHSKPARVRVNRDTTYFGISPNGEYDFGGGTALCRRYPSKSGNTISSPAIRCLTRFPALLSGSPFAYTIAIAPPYFSNGPHIGPAAISRNNVNAYFQDTWKITSRFTLDYGFAGSSIRPSASAPAAHRLPEPRMAQQFVRGQSAARLPHGWKGWGPRIQAAWQISDKWQAHAGGAITVIPPNIWQDNFLTGSTPFAVYPRLLSASNAPINYGFQITPSQLPRAYTPQAMTSFPPDNPTRLRPIP